MRPSCIAVSLAALVACADIAEPGPETSGNVVHATSPAELWLAVGGEAWVDSILRLDFTQVVSDSRCPSSVVCVWAGDGAVQVATGLGMGPSVPDTLHTTLDPRHLDFGGYHVTLLELAPYPASTDPIPADAYAVRLRVERLIR